MFLGDVKQTIDLIYQDNEVEYSQDDNYILEVTFIKKLHALTTARHYVDR